MAILKKRLAGVVGIISIGILLSAIAFGISIKEKNKQGIITSQIPNRDYQTENKDTQVTQPKKICRELLEEDENGLILKEYGKVEAVDCMSVGCGGVL